MKKIYCFLTILCCISLLFSCSDQDRNCPHKFKEYERQWFNYTVGQELKFASTTCQDTIILTITERKISEGDFGKYPEALNGKCFSYLKVNGTFSSPNSPNNCFDINEEIRFIYQRISGTPNCVFINMDGNWEGNSIYYLPASDEIISGKYYKSVGRNYVSPDSDYKARYVYYQMGIGFLRIVFEENGETATFERVF